MKPQHFLTLNSLSSQELKQLMYRAIELKEMQKNGDIFEPLKNQTLAMIFEKASTRTRLSFETGMTQLGGHAIFLSPDDTQLGRGEPIEDSARVISSMADGIMIRTFQQETVETMARHSSVPVINALTDDFHPCQLLADMQTYYEHRGDISGKTVVWYGDGNNMCNSYIESAELYGFNLKVSCPEGYEPNADLVKKHSARVELISDPLAAAENADLIVTDVWASMGQEDEVQERKRIFAPYEVTQSTMQQADKDALFMHCLPAYRGLEVSAEVIDGNQSVVWDEAENRLHAQKALLEFLMG